MASRKNVKTPPRTAAKAAIKTAIKVAPKPAVTNAPVHMHGGSCCAPVAASDRSVAACLHRLGQGCPITKLLITRSFWASSVVAFIALFASDWMLHTKVLMADYAANSAFWRADGEIRHGLIFVTQTVTAMAYAAIILALGHAGRWWGSLTSGMLAAVPVAMCAMTAYIMLPFASPDIPLIWGIAAILQGGLAGLAICAALKLSRAPEAGYTGTLFSNSTQTLH